MDNVAQNFPTESVQLASWLFLSQLLPLELRAQGRGYVIWHRPRSAQAPWMILGKLLVLAGLSALSHNEGALRERQHMCSSSASAWHK